MPSECVFVEADSSWDGLQSHASPDRGTRGRRWKPANESPAWLPSPPELPHLSYPDPDGESASSKLVTAGSDVMSCFREGPSVVLVSRVPRLRPPRASLQLQPGTLISLRSFFSARLSLRRVPVTGRTKLQSRLRPRAVVSLLPTQHFRLDFPSSPASQPPPNPRS